jgi:hypothetical protein
MRPSGCFVVRTTLTQVCLLGRFLDPQSDAMSSVFNAGFVEASSDTTTFEITGDTNLDNVDAASDYTALGAHPEDSDEEDEAYDPGESDGDPPNSDQDPEDVPRDFLLEPGMSVAAEEAEGGDDVGGEGEDEKPRNVRQKVAHPSSPRGVNAQILPRSGAATTDRDIPGPPKLRVVVKDVSYATYRAVLYYVLLLLLLFLALHSCFASCIRIESDLHHCRRPSFRRVRLGPLASKIRTTVRPALVPSRVRDLRK